MNDQSSAMRSGQSARLQTTGPREGTRSYKVQIDDLPEETINASTEAELAEVLRAGLLNPPFDHVGNDVHLTITRQDGSSWTSTVAEQRDVSRTSGEPMPRRPL